MPVEAATANESAPKPHSANSQAKRSLRAVECLNFFVADVQTGLGPFLAAYLASSGWNPGRVGFTLTFGGLVTVATQTPAGAVIDAVYRKRTLLALNLVLLVIGALLLMGSSAVPSVYSAQFLIGAAGAFLAPTIAAITTGITGASSFDRQFGRNQSFNSAGNVFTALLVAYISYKFGYRAIFAVAALLSIPAAMALFSIDANQIDYTRARGGSESETETKNAKTEKAQPQGLSALLQDRVLIFFLLCALLFHLANAAMLPMLGELLSKNNPKAAAPFMSACVIVTQLVITLTAAWISTRAAKNGRKKLLLVGYGALPIRAVLYTLTHWSVALIAIQILDGVANAIFVTVSILIIKDRTAGTGRFNIAAGALATMVGIGAALSNTVGGQLIVHFNFATAFLGLAAIAALAFTLVWFTVPETLHNSAQSDAAPV